MAHLNGDSSRWLGRRLLPLLMSVRLDDKLSRLDRPLLFPLVFPLTDWMELAEVPLADAHAPRLRNRRREAKPGWNASASRDVPGPKGLQLLVPPELHPPRPSSASMVTRAISWYPV